MFSFIITEAKIIRKQLVIIGIIALLVHVGFSGCFSSNLIVKINGPSFGTVNEKFLYNASVQGGTKPYTYAWDLDNDGKYADSNNKTAVFTTTYSGIHVIKIKVTDKNGNQKEANTTLILSLTETNMVLKNVVVSSSNPVEKENIYFNLTLENIRDNATPKMALGLNWTHRDGNVSSSWRGNLFSLEGHSQNNITLSTGINNTDEGMQSFKIVYYDFQHSKEITLTIINISIEPLSPEIYLSTTIGNITSSGTYPEKITFNASETVYVYIEYRNVNHNGIVDVNLSIVVHYQESLVVYYTNNKDDKQISKSDVWYAYWNFPTYDEYNGNWPSGKYQIDIRIQDRITGETNTKTIFFTIL